MSRSSIFISGLVNVESSIKVDSFPINYSPVEYLFDGISTTVSGVGYNVSKALRTLGDEVHIHTLIGDDALGKVVKHELENVGIGIEGTYQFLSSTPQSIVLYDKNGNRKIYCDLKDIQTSNYPDSFMYDIHYDLAILTNVNFSRIFFEKFKSSDTPIATDCHVLKDVNSEYDKAFLENADIIFMSNDGIIGKEEYFMEQLISKYNHRIIVISMGAKGCILYDASLNSIYKVPAVSTRPVVNTVGAGDALFSSFLHFYIGGKDSLTSIRLATLFASYKIGSNGGAEGFLDESTLIRKYEESTK